MISVIVCSRSNDESGRMAEHVTEAMGEEPHEFIGIIGATSMAGGYNQGFAKSIGDIVIFAHDDIDFISSAFIPKMKEHLRHYDVVGVAGTDRLIGSGWLLAGPPHIFGQVITPDGEGFMLNIFGALRPVIGRIQALDGCFIACQREVAEAVRWDDNTFDHFHGYDVDFAFRAFLGGFEMGVANDLVLLHDSIGNFDENWQQYSRRFFAKHMGKLSPFAERNFSFATVYVKTLNDALELAAPSYWGL